MPSLRLAIADRAPEVAHGVVQQVDLIDRGVIVRQDSGTKKYLVSANCEVLLNGERVKLRMLQPRDQVRIAYRPRGEGCVALSVEAVTRSSPSPPAI